MKKSWEKKYTNDISMQSTARLNRWKEEDQEDLLEILKTENLIC